MRASIVFKFCHALEAKLKLREGGLVAYCIENSPKAVANAVFLMGCYLMLRCNHSSQRAASVFSSLDIAPFRDATFVRSDYDLRLVDCLSGLEKATSLGWFDISREGGFDVDTYEYFNNPTHGDIHQVSNKLFAFKGPLAQGSPMRQMEEVVFVPEFYAHVFLALEVNAVVRLNEANTYDKQVFERAGIQHYDLFFDDCTVPSTDLVERFFAICRRHSRVAVHCRAGLGRTGTMIALWLMHEHSFAASETIAWLRICRPGSVIGPQQHYLQSQEPVHGAYSQVGPSGMPPPTVTPSAADCQALAEQLTRCVIRRSQVLVSSETIPHSKNWRAFFQAPVQAATRAKQQSTSASESELACSQIVAPTCANLQTSSSLSSNLRLWVAPLQPAAVGASTSSFLSRRLGGLVKTVSRLNRFPTHLETMHNRAAH